MKRTLSHIVGELEQIEKGKRALKERAMRYQPDLKDTVAKAIGLSSGKELDLPFKEWAKIRDAYLLRTCDWCGEYYKDYDDNFPKDCAEGYCQYCHDPENKLVGCECEK